MANDVKMRCTTLHKRSTAFISERRAHYCIYPRCNSCWYLMIISFTNQEKHMSGKTKQYTVRQNKNKASGRKDVVSHGFKQYCLCEKYWTRLSSTSTTMRTYARIGIDHDEVIKWKHFPRYWSIVRGIHRSLVNSHTKGSDAELRCFLWSVLE